MFRRLFQRVMDEQEERAWAMGGFAAELLKAVTTDEAGRLGLRPQLYDTNGTLVWEGE